MAVFRKKLNDIKSDMISMTSTMSGPLKVADTGLSAQDIISLPKAPIKYGILRRKNPTITFGKWPHRFIVLLRDSVYVYHDEKSKSTSSSFSLLGYNRVKRTTSKKHEWCFVVLPDHTLTSIKPEKFACLSDADRMEWMIAFRTQMYPANNMDCYQYRPMSFSDEDEYRRIEEPVYDPRNKEPDKISTTSEDESSSSESEPEGKVPVYHKTTRSFSMPKALTQDEVARVTLIANAKKRPERKVVPPPLEIVDEEEESKKMVKAGKKLTRMTSDPPRYSAVMNDVKTISGPKECPDYKNLVQMTELANGKISDEPEESGEPELYDIPPEDARPPPGLCDKRDDALMENQEMYEVPIAHAIPPIPKRHEKKQTNTIPPLPKKHQTRAALVKPPPEPAPEEVTPPIESLPDELYELPLSDPASSSLETLCTVEDNNPDRDYIICLLQSKKLSGTYLIRKSRQSGDKVLAYLTQNGYVKEYKIYSLGVKVYMERGLMFDTVDELLRYYTCVGPLPCSDHRLKHGFHTVH